MDKFVLVVQPSSQGWQVTVWEGCFTVYDADGLPSPFVAQERGEYWLVYHRGVCSFITEIRAVPDNAADGIAV